MYITLYNVIKGNSDLKIIFTRTGNNGRPDDVESSTFPLNLNDNRRLKLALHGVSYQHRPWMAGKVLEKSSVS